MREVLALAVQDYKSGKLLWSWFFSADCRLICDLADVRENVIRQRAREQVRAA